MSNPLPDVIVGDDPVIRNHQPVNVSARNTSLPVISPSRKSISSTTSSSHEINNVTQYSQSQSQSVDYDDDQQGFVLVHHEEKAHFILSSYCLPVNQSVDKSLVHKCRFGRNCIVHKNKVLDRGDTESSISPTVFSRSKNYSKEQFMYNILDTRFIKCFAPTCKQKNSDQAKIFHHVCYMNFIYSDNINDLGVIELKESNTPLVEYVKNIAGSDIRIPKSGTTILPSCGKQCQKKIIRMIESLTQVKKNTMKADGTTKTHWDKDGTSTTRTSIQMLVDWLTTEENSSSYFGGKNSKGQTNGSRRETHHYAIAELIKAENGKFIYLLMIHK
jgi:hypothetical protein